MGKATGRQRSVRLRAVRSCLQAPVGPSYTSAICACKFQILEVKQCTFPCLGVESSSDSVELAFGCVVWVVECFARSPEELVPASVIGSASHTTCQAISGIGTKVLDIMSWADEGIWLLFPL
eukprot:508690-Amphidinium_carterae.1